MSVQLRPRSLGLRCVAAGMVCAAFLAGSPAQASEGSLTFHATVSGKTHESGKFTAAESLNGSFLLGYTGCAVMKPKAGSKLGSYRFIVQTAPIQQAGIKPSGPGVNLVVQDFSPNKATATYKGYIVAGTFTINGHSYADGGALAHGSVQIKNGGKDGTWTDPTAQRNYPAQILKPVPGFSFKATWHCTAILHVTSQ